MTILGGKGGKQVPPTLQMPPPMPMLTPSSMPPTMPPASHAMPLAGVGVGELDEEKAEDMISHKVAGMSIDEMEKEMKDQIAKRAAEKEMKDLRQPKKQMKRPAAAFVEDEVWGERPVIPKDPAPVHYLQGRIYDARDKVRVYLQKGDRIEKRFTYHDEETREAAYNKAFNAIEMDSRVKRRH